MRLYKQHIESAIKSLSEYGETRMRYTQKGIEAPELSALLLEKYSIGMREALSAVDPKCNTDPIIEMTDKLCRFIDPEYEENRTLRYKKVGKLDLSTDRT